MLLVEDANKLLEDANKYASCNHHLQFNGSIYLTWHVSKHCLCEGDVSYNLWGWCILQFEISVERESNCVNLSILNFKIICMW